MIEQANSQTGRIPTAGELARLPGWVIVAFAVRCAQRVQPLFEPAWPGAAPKHIAAIDKAIEVAARAARHGIAGSRAVAQARDAAALAAAVSGLPHKRIGPARDIAESAVRAAQAAARAADRRPVTTIAASARHAARAAAAAVKGIARKKGLSEDAAAALGFAMIQEVRADLEFMVVGADYEGWSANTAIDPRAFGVLWVDEPPAGWEALTAQQAAAQPEDDRRSIPD